MTKETYRAINAVVQSVRRQLEDSPDSCVSKERLETLLDASEELLLREREKKPK